MKFDLFSRIPVAANRVLATLAVLTGLSLATPSASADITLTYLASDVGTGLTNSTGTGATNDLITPTLTVGNFKYSVTAHTQDPGGGTTNFPGSSTLSNLTFAVQNTGSGTDTLDISLTGAGYTLTGLLRANFSVSGSSSQSSSADQTIGSSQAGGFDIPTVAGTTLTGTPTAGPGSQPYAWTGGLPSSPNLGESNELFFSNPSGTFSESQLLQIKLNVGDSVTLSFNTSVTPVPEPSSMAIAGLGALGLIGYGLRRRKALGA